MQIKVLTIISMVLILSFFFPLSSFTILPAYAEEKGTNSYAQDFLGKSEGQRVWWYMGAFAILGDLVEQTNKEQADCIWNWYFKEPEKKRMLIEETMRKFPEYAPPSVVLSLLYRDCGKFTVK